MKTDGNSPAFGVGTDNYHIECLSKREHFAAMAADDFNSLTKQQQEIIIGLPAPDVNKKGYATWLAKGRAKWRLIQADALISELNNE